MYKKMYSDNINTNYENNDTKFRSEQYNSELNCNNNIVLEKQKQS